MSHLYTIEIDIITGFGLITVFGLISLKSQHVNQALVKFACVCWPLSPLSGYITDLLEGVSIISLVGTASYDMLLSAIVIIVLRKFKNFEALLLLLIAYVAQYYIIHSTNLIYFYICLEAQNFCFLVICGLQPNKKSAGFTVEASLKYILLSALSSGVLLFALANLYLQTGQIGVDMIITVSEGDYGIQIIITFILLAILFKLGAAPLHL